MLKRFVVHLGNGLFLSKLVDAVEIVATDAEKLAVAAAPVVMEVAQIEGAFVSNDQQQLIQHVTKLTTLVPNLVAEVHEVITTPVWTSARGSLNLGNASAPAQS